MPASTTKPARAAGPLLPALLCLVAACAAEPAGPTAPGAGAGAGAPVTLLLVIDQLPADALFEIAPRLGDDGLGRFLQRGVVYAAADYPYASTLTAVAHASIATGHLPRRHGVVGNAWWDRTERRLVYSASAPGGTGRGPGRLLVPAVADALAGEGVPTWAVSLKDRAAIFLAGRSGTAFWYERSEGRFVTDPGGPFLRRAGPEPGWFAGASQTLTGDRYAGATWRASRPLDTYRWACPPGRDDCPPSCETRSPFATGRLPVELSADPAVARHQVRATPMADELTVDFVEALVQAELPPGEPALLAVSLSASDYVGHAFGPHSLEYEDNLLRLDLTVERLLRILERRFGPERVVGILTADHGVGPRPGCAAARGLPAGRLTGRELEALADDFLARERPGTGAGTIVTNADLYLTGAETLPATVSAVAAFLETVPGVARVIPGSRLAGDRPADASGDDLLARAWRSFHPARSGDLVIVPRRYWYYAGDDSSAAMHGSPWPYDTRVPLVLLAPGLAPARVDRPVSPLAVAATVAGLYGASLPGATAALDEARELPPSRTSGTLPASSR